MASLPLNHNVYEAIAEAGLRTPDIPVRAVEYYAQCGEDLIVLALLRALALREGLDLSRERYLEIGANHPVATSATWLLHRVLGMRGVLVEANPRLLDALRRHRPGDEVVHAAVHAGEAEAVELHVSNQDELSSLDRDFVVGWRGGAVGTREVVRVPALRIGALMASHFPDRAPAYLSIDIEGMDLAVLRDLDVGRHRPAVVQAEPSDHHHPGNTEEIARFLASVGYAVVARTEVNLIALDAGRAGLPSSAGDDPAARRLLDDALRAAREREAALADRDARLEARDRMIAERDAALTQARQELRATAAAAEAASSSARSEAEALAGRVAALEHRAAELAAERDTILASSSWRVTAPLRALTRQLRGR